MLISDIRVDIGLLGTGNSKSESVLFKQYIHVMPLCQRTHIKKTSKFIPDMKESTHLTLLYSSEINAVF